MATQIYATVGNTTTQLTDGVVYWRQGDDTLGVAPSHRIAERGPQQNGETDLGFRLDPRVFHLFLGVAGNNLSDYYNARDKLSRILKPNRSPIKLLFVLDNGASRQIDCYQHGGLTFDSKDRNGFSQDVTAELYAPDPTYYDPASKQFTFAVGGGSGGFTVPTPVPTAFGASVLNSTQNLSYSGSFATFPVINLVGPLTNPVIQNLTTGDKLDFTGVSIAQGDFYTIDTRYGYKTIIDSYGNNQIAKLVTPGSGLATFHIEADPDAPGGINSIQATATSINQKSAIVFSYYNRYIAI